MSKTHRSIADRNQRVLLELVSQPGNDICADCKGRAPRWASHNLGIFICVRCASIHRKIGTHVTKVRFRKSLTLDQWTKEQVDNMKAIGNVKSNQYYNPDERANPIPANMEESERDSELEQYIRAKYQYRRFVDKLGVVTSRLGPSKSKLDVPKRSYTAPIPQYPPQPSTNPNPASTSRQTELSAPPLPTRSSSAALPALSAPAVNASATAPAAPALNQTNVSPTQPFSRAPVTIPQFANSQTISQTSTLTQSTFDDLISLQSVSQSASLPLQYQNTSSTFQTLASAINPVQNRNIFGQQAFSTPSVQSRAEFMSASPLASSGTPMNPFQISHQFTPQLSPQMTSALPQTLATGTGYPMATLSQPQPQPQAPAVNPFMQQQSGVINPPPLYSFQPNPSPQIPQFPSSQPQSGFVSRTPPTYSNQVQQAQQVFQSMAGSSNPFNGQGWR